MKKIFLVSVTALGVLAMAGGCADRVTNNPPGGKILGGDSGADTGSIIASGNTRLGQKCLVDRDCGGTLICLAGDSTVFGGGGPGNGICTADCSQDDTLCETKIDPNSVCVGVSSSLASGPAYCMQSCTIGQGATGVKRCQGREDVSCDDLGSSVAGLGFCSPQCRGDEDCPAPRKCNLSSGLCVDASDITGTLAIGSNCDPTLAKDPCGGFCLGKPLDDGGVGGPGWCTGFCRVGTIGCGGSASGNGAPDVACLFPLSQDTSVGDIGICGQLCDCNDNCRTTGRVCRPFSANDRQFYGRAGYCGGATDSTTGKAAENIPCSGQKPDGGPEPSDSGAVDSGSVDSGSGSKDAGASG